MIQLLLNRRNAQQQRFIQTIRVHAVLERNTNSAVEDLQNKKMQSIQKKNCLNALIFLLISMTAFEIITSSEI